MATLFEFETLSGIQAVMNEVTDEMINRTGSKMDPPKEGETIVGTLHDREASRLYCAMRKMKAQAEAFIAQIPTAEDDEAEHALKVNADRMRELYKVAKDIFWAEVQEKMDLWAKNVGVRKNWTVVTSDSSVAEAAVSKFESFLRQMGGIGGIQISGIED